MIWDFLSIQGHRLKYGGVTSFCIFYTFFLGGTEFETGVWAAPQPPAPQSAQSAPHHLQPAQGQQGDTSKGTGTGDQKTIAGSSGQYLGGRRGAMRWSRWETGPQAWLRPLPGAGTPCKSQLPRRSLRACLCRINTLCKVILMVCSHTDFCHIQRKGEDFSRRGY